MPKIFLFLSTGRCGTQWLASNLTDAFGDSAYVTHEPLDARYRPREFFRAPDRMDDMLKIDVVRNHLDRVERTIDQRRYIETGWPSYAAIPLFLKRFGDQVGLVRIARNPVPTAISLVTHGFWSGRADRYARDGILDPWCDGVVQAEYGRRWRDMSPYEKCLFWWTELHLYADDLKSQFRSTPFHETTFEGLFDAGGVALEELASFLGVPGSVSSLQRSVLAPSDERRQQTSLRFDWWEVFDHPTTLAVAERLGYKIRWHDAKALRARYRVTAPAWTSRIKRAARWARARASSTR